jgi:hypothetical protein
LQKKAPNVLKSLDAEMESPRLEGARGWIDGSSPFMLFLCSEGSFSLFGKSKFMLPHFQVASTISTDFARVRRPFEITRERKFSCL